MPLNNLHKESIVQANFQAFFELSNDLLCSTDLEGNFLRINSQFENILGLSEEIAIGKKFYQYIHPDDRMSVLRKFLLIVNKKVNHIDFTNRFVHENGQIIYLNWQCYVDYEKKEILGTARDITELKETQLALEKNEALLTAVLESMPNPMRAVDEDKRVIFYNAALQNFYKFRYGVEIDIGKTYEQMFRKHPQIYSAWNERIDKVLDGETLEFQHQYRVKNEDRFNHIKTLPIKDMSDKIVGALTFSTDITTIKIKEQELREKNKELQNYIESNLQLENFAHLASHDLKAPLQNIINYTDLLRSRIPEESEESTFLNYIEHGASNMSQTIKSLLNFSQVSNKKVLYEDMSLNELLNDLTVDLKTIIQKELATIEFPAKDQFICVDKSLMRQMFQNLILNAIKFRKENKTPRIKISTRDTKKFVEISVEDNGIGIEEEFHQSIFTLFKRLDSKYEGTGAGLATCKKIVEMHDGEIKVSSIPGEGSTFTFSIKKRCDGSKSI